MKQESGATDPKNAQGKRIQALVDLPDSEIDTSEIPEWTDRDFAHAVPFSQVYKPRKEQITTRIDSDILLWLKSHGKGYQTFINNLLRKEMLAEKKRRA